MRYINSTKTSLYNLFKIINIICITVYFIWYITPVFRAYFYGTFFNAIIIGLIGVWLLTAILLNPKWIFQWNLHLIIVTIQIIGFIIMALLGIGGGALAYMKIGVSFWFTLYVYHFYASLGWRMVIGRIGTLVLISLFITGITTLIGLISIPSAARMLTSSSTLVEDNFMLNSKNIGGFDFVYGLIIFIPTLISFMIFRRTRGKINLLKLSFLLLIILIFYITLKSSFTIALISLILGIVLGLISKMKPRSIILVIILSCVVYQLLPNETLGGYLNKVAYNLENPYVSERLHDIGNNLKGVQSTSSHLSNRTILYDMSFNTFIDHPITGVGPYYYVSGVGVGYHSQILDDLARYGVFGLSFYLLFFYTFYKYINKQWKKLDFNGNLFVSLLIFLFVSFLNPTFSSQTISIIVFFLLPALPDIVRYLVESSKMYDSELA